MFAITEDDGWRPSLRATVAAAFASPAQAAIPIRTQGRSPSCWPLACRHRHGYDRAALRAKRLSHSLGKAGGDRQSSRPPP